MILLKGQMNGKPMVVIGLSRSNVDKLVAGQPILTAGPKGAMIITFGETEFHIKNDLQRLGWMKDEKPLN